jgi:hypothetical protein
VCQQDSVCCSSVWDDTCVDEVDQLGCGSCGGSSSSGGGGGECCIPTGGPGCPDPMVEQCVCTFDSYCCTDDWDDTCVQEVLQFGCGIC